MPRPLAAALLALLAAACAAHDGGPAHAHADAESTTAASSASSSSSSDGVRCSQSLAPGFDVAWRLHNGSVTFDVTASPARLGVSAPLYAAALGLGRSMVDGRSGCGGTGAYVAWLEDAGGQPTGHVVSYLLTQWAAGGVTATREALTDVAVSRDAATGALAFRFTRPLAAGGGVEGRPASCGLAAPPAAGAGAGAAAPQPLVWAVFPSWTPGQGLFGRPRQADEHTKYSAAFTAVDLSAGGSAGGCGTGGSSRSSAHGAAAAAGEGGLETGLVVHAVLMALAWGLLLPGAGLCARFLKPGGATLCGLSFFRAHLFLASSGALLVLVAALTAYAHVGGDGGRHGGSPHARLGLLLSAAACGLQPLAGALRPHPPPAPAPGASAAAGPHSAGWERRAWEFGHKNAGRLLCLLGGVAAVTGLQQSRGHGARGGAVDAGLALWVLWCVLGLGGGGAWLEARRRAGAAADAALSE